MPTTPRPLPTGLTAGVLYLIAAGLLGTLLMASTSIGLPAVVATSGIAVLAVGFPIAVLVAVIVRPGWLRTVREATFALFHLSTR